MYVHGGLGSYGYAFYQYSLKTRRWKKYFRVEHRFSHTNVLVNDKIYIVGGGSNELPYSREIAVQTFDLITNEFDGAGRCPIFAGSALYVESRQEILMFGHGNGEEQDVVVFGYDLATQETAKYRVIGGFAPRMARRQAVVQFGQRFFHLSVPYNSGRCLLYMLTLGSGYTANWCKLYSRGDDLPNTDAPVFQVVQGLLIIFGGKRKNEEVSDDDIFLFDPNTFEGVSFGKALSVPSLKYVGNWPKAPFRGSGVATNGKLWIFGGQSSHSIIKLEIKRAQA